MQRMGRLSDIFPSLGPVCRFFLFELMFLQTELKFHNVTQSLSQHDKITSLPSVRSQTPPSLCENSSHCRIPVQLFAPSSDEKSNDPHLDQRMSKLYRFILSLTFESPSYSFSIHPNIINTSYFVKKKGEDSFLSYMIVNLLLQVVPQFFFTFDLSGNTLNL